MFNVFEMASKRQQRRKACLGKQRYAEWDEAAKHAMRIGGHTQPYHCTFCGHYHVGHIPLRMSEFAAYGKDKHRG